ncbi:hypothetical protein [Hydrogenophaga taeniospiralis]|nr:hypothetical protein [Hydrogenophaga taeniospiralis]UCU92239.1 hypothetical protein KI616_15355 [Hydrogenophaga taeniospiralis]
MQIETGQFLLMAANHSVTELKGMFGKPAKVVSVQEMNQAVAACGMEER